MLIWRELRLTSGEWLHKGLRRQSDEESIGASATDGKASSRLTIIYCDARRMVYSHVPWHADLIADESRTKYHGTKLAQTLLANYF